MLKVKVINIIHIEGSGRKYLVNLILEIQIEMEPDGSQLA